MRSIALAKQARFLQDNFPEVWLEIQSLPRGERPSKIRRNYRHYADPLRDGLTVAEISMEFHIPQRTIYEWIKTGTVDVLSRSPTRIERKELEQIVARHTRIKEDRKHIAALVASGIKRESAYVHRSRKNNLKNRKRAEKIKRIAKQLTALVMTAKKTTCPGCPIYAVLSRLLTKTEE